MKRWIVFAAVLSLLCLAAVSPGELRVLTGAGSDPQTFSFKTSKGFYARSWTVAAFGSGCMVKFRNTGSGPDWWKRLEAGEAFSSPWENSVSVDSFIVDPDNVAAFSFQFTGYGTP